MQLRLVSVTIGMALSFVSTPSLGKVLAQCGASTGMSYYDKEPVWSPDKITGGAWQFVYDDKGNPNVLFRDATGGVTDSSADGAKIIVTFIHPDLQEFGLVAIYEPAGVVETYNVIMSSTGSRKLYWTSNKSRGSPLAKVSAYTADCD